MQTPAPWQCRAFILLGISILGTLLAGLVLILDGWVDALALYVACVLALVLLLCRFAEPRTQPQIAVSIGNGRADPGGPAGLVLTRANGVWTGADRTAIRAAPSHATPTD